jgi:oligopeptide transport system permease protein
MVFFLLRRLFSSFLVLFCAASLTFLLSISQKGGPFEKEKLDEKAKLEKQMKYELDGPKWWQLVRYQKRLFLHGDLNVSLRYRDRSVAEILGQKLPNSLLLGSCAFLIASVGGVAAGFVAAMKKDSLADVMTMLFALAAISVPTFITGPLVAAVFGLWRGWLPIGGFGTWQQLILPSICLALPFLAYVARLTRNNLLDVMSLNHMRTAKAKGLDEATALARARAGVVFSSALETAVGARAALRLAFTLSGGTPVLLAGTALRRFGGELRLRLVEGSGVFAGESVQRRLDTLANALGLAATVEVAGA